MLCLLAFDFYECHLLFICEYGQGTIKTLHQMDFSNMYIKAFWWQVNSCKLHFERLFVFVLNSGWITCASMNGKKITLKYACDDVVRFLKIPSQYLSSLLLLPSVIWQNKSQTHFCVTSGIKHCWLFQQYLLAVFLCIVFDGMFFYKQIT